MWFFYHLNVTILINSNSSIEVDHFQCKLKILVFYYNPSLFPKVKILLGIVQQSNLQISRLLLKYEKSNFGIFLKDQKALLIYFFGVYYRNSRFLIIYSHPWKIFLNDTNQNFCAKRLWFKFPVLKKKITINNAWQL